MSQKYLLNTASAQGYVRTLAGRQNLRVVFSKDDIQPYTDPVRKTIHVQEPKWDWPLELAADWRGKIVHELGHHRGANSDLMDFFVARGINTKEFRGTVINILLDYINDAQWQGEYAGAHRDVCATQIVCATHGLAGVKKRGIPPDAKTQKLVEVFSWIYNQRAATYQKPLAGIAAQWEKLIPFGWLNAFNAELNSLTTGEDIEELTRKICDGDEQGGQDEGGEKGSDSEGEQEDEVDPAGGDLPSKEVWVSYKDLLLADDHSKEKGSPGKVRIDYDHSARHNYAPFGAYIEIDLSTDKETTHE